MAASWRQLEDVKIFSAIFNSVPEKTGFWFAPYIGQGWGNALKNGRRMLWRPAFRVLDALTRMLVSLATWSPIYGRCGRQRGSMPGFDFSQAVRLVAISIVPALLGIILHEVAHGWMARRCGDHTAEALGRLTLNPIPHIDPMGLAVFGLTSLTGSFVFGWAKPVPVDPRNFRQPRRDMMLVSLAGPVTNFLLAIAFGLGLFAALHGLPPSQYKEHGWYIFLLSSLQAGVVINFGLGWLNLLPIPPLDGSKILAYFLPSDMAWRYLEMGRYGFIILLVLLGFGVLGKILGPLVRFSSMTLLSALGLA